MTIKDTFLYYWCFISDKDDKTLFKRDNFSKIIFILIVVLGLSGLGILGYLVIFLASLIGDSISMTGYCIHNTIIIAFLSCGLSGLFFLLLCVIDILMLLLILSPLIFCLCKSLSCIFANKINNILCKCIYCILLVMILPLSIYGNLLLGVAYNKIFYIEGNRCNLNNYRSLVNLHCFTSGSSASMIIIGVYIGLVLISGIIFLILKYCGYCVKTWDQYLAYKSISKQNEQSLLSSISCDLINESNDLDIDV